MHKTIAILTGCCLALVVSAQAAEQPNEATVKAQKNKNAPKQQVAPKQPQARTMPNTHAPHSSARTGTSPKSLWSKSLTPSNSGAFSRRPSSEYVQPW